MRSQKDIVYFRSLLEEEKSRVLQECHRLRRGRTGEERSTWHDEGTDEDGVSADAATALMEKEQDLRLFEELEERLEEIDHALESIENGTYGVCELCQSPINPARLEALPWATLCLSCREMVGG